MLLLKMCSSSFFWLYDFPRVFAATISSYSEQYPYSLLRFVILRTDSFVDPSVFSPLSMATLAVFDSSHRITCPKTIAMVVTLCSWLLLGFVSFFGFRRLSFLVSHPMRHVNYTAYHSQYIFCCIKNKSQNIK